MIWYYIIVPRYKAGVLMQSAHWLFQVQPIGNVYKWIRINFLPKYRGVASGRAVAEM